MNANETHLLNSHTLRRDVRKSCLHAWNIAARFCAHFLFCYRISVCLYVCVFLLRSFNTYAIEICVFFSIFLEMCICVRAHSRSRNTRVFFFYCSRSRAPPSLCARIFFLHFFYLRSWMHRGARARTHATASYY